MSYYRVVDMLLNLMGHIRPNIADTVSMVARFIFAPKLSNEAALKKLGC